MSKSKKTSLSRPLSALLVSGALVFTADGALAAPSASATPAPAALAASAGNVPAYQQANVNSKVDLSAVDSPYADKLGYELKPAVNSVEKLQALRTQVSEAEDVDPASVALYQARIDALIKLVPWLEENRELLKTTELVPPHTGGADQQKRRTGQNFRFDSRSFTGLYAKTGLSTLPTNLTPGTPTSNTVSLSVFVDGGQDGQVKLSLRRLGHTGGDPSYHAYTYRDVPLKQGYNRVVLRLNAGEAPQNIYVRNLSWEKATVRIMADDAFAGAEPGRRAGEWETPSATPSILGTQLQNHPVYIYDPAHPERYWDFLQDVRRYNSEMRRHANPSNNPERWDMADLRFGRQDVSTSVTSVIVSSRGVDNAEKAARRARNIYESLTAHLELIDDYQGMATDLTDEKQQPDLVSNVVMNSSTNMWNPSTMFAFVDYYALNSTDAGGYLSGDFDAPFQWGSAHEHGHMVDSLYYKIDELTNNMYSIESAFNRLRRQAHRNRSLNLNDNSFNHPAIADRMGREGRPSMADRRMLKALGQSDQGGSKFGPGEIWYGVLNLYEAGQWFKANSYADYPFGDGLFRPEWAQKVKRFGAWGSFHSLLRRSDVQDISRAVGGSEPARWVAGLSKATGYNMCPFFVARGYEDMPEEVKRYCRQYPKLPVPLQYYDMGMQKRRVLHEVAPERVPYFDQNTRVSLESLEGGNLRLRLDGGKKDSIGVIEIYRDGLLVGFTRSLTFHDRTAPAGTTASDYEFKAYDFEFNLAGEPTRYPATPPEPNKERSEMSLSTRAMEYSGSPVRVRLRLNNGEGAPVYEWTKMLKVVATKAADPNAQNGEDPQAGQPADIGQGRFQAVDGEPGLYEVRVYPRAAGRVNLSVSVQHPARPGLEVLPATPPHLFDFDPITVNFVDPSELGKPAQVTVSGVPEEISPGEELEGVKIRVLDALDKPMADQEVQVTLPDGRQVVARTDQEGQALLEPVTLTEISTHSFTVHVGDLTKNVEFKVRENPEPDPAPSVDPEEGDGSGTAGEQEGDTSSAGEAGAGESESGASGEESGAQGEPEVPLVPGDGAGASESETGEVTPGESGAETPGAGGSSAPSEGAETASGAEEAQPEPGEGSTSGESEQTNPSDENAAGTEGNQGAQGGEAGETKDPESAAGEQEFTSEPGTTGGVEPTPPSEENGAQGEPEVPLVPGDGAGTHEGESETDGEETPESGASEETEGGEETQSPAEPGAGEQTGETKDPAEGPAAVEPTPEGSEPAGESGGESEVPLVPGESEPTEEPNSGAESEAGEQSGTPDSGTQAGETGASETPGGQPAEPAGEGAESGEAGAEPEIPLVTPGQSEEKPAAGESDQGSASSEATDGAAAGSSSQVSVGTQTEESGDPAAGSTVSAGTQASGPGSVSVSTQTEPESRPASGGEAASESATSAGSGAVSGGQSAAVQSGASGAVRPPASRPRAPQRDTSRATSASPVAPHSPEQTVAPAPVPAPQVAAPQESPTTPQSGTPTPSAEPRPAASVRQSGSLGTIALVASSGALVLLVAGGILLVARKKRKS